MNKQKLFKTSLLALLTLACCITHASGQPDDVRIAKYKGNAVAAISYTFDDGLEEHYTLVYPHLQELGIRGTFWIIGRNIDRQKAVREAPPMTWRQVRELAEYGHEVSSHTYSHTNMTRMTRHKWQREIERNDSAIYTHAGVHPRTLCFPGNAKNDSLLQYVASRKDIIAARTYQQSFGGKLATAPSSNGINRLDAYLDKTIKDGSWGVTMTHAITKGYDAFPDPDIFWAHLKRAKQLADAGLLWIAPFVEVAEYTKGISEEVTFILPYEPASVMQGKTILTPYQSHDGSWCVDGKRHIPLKIQYEKQ